MIKLDEIGISEILERVKEIWVERKNWELLKKTFNEDTEDEDQELTTIKKGTKNGRAIKLVVIKKSHQDFIRNYLGKDKEIVRASMNTNSYEELSVNNASSHDLYGKGETLDWLKNKKGKNDIIIVTILKPRKLRQIIKTLQKQKTK